MLGHSIGPFFVDMEKAFDMVPRHRLLQVLNYTYDINDSMLEMIHRLYIAM